MAVENRRQPAAQASVRGHVIAALVLFALDTFVLGQGVITALVVLGMMVLGIVYVAIGVARDRARLRHGIRIIAIYLVLAGGVFGTIHLNNLIARHRANWIIAALKAYKAQHGCYPERLDDLVPEYLSSIPLRRGSALVT